MKAYNSTQSVAVSRETFILHMMLCGNFFSKTVCHTVQKIADDDLKKKKKTSILLVLTSMETEP